MKQEYQQLHSGMLHDIEQCLQLQLPEKDRVENCFWIAQNYWQQLKSLLRNKKFINEDEEIDFFRNVKPHFTCYMEYFVLLCESLQFVPDEIDRAISFWENECTSPDRFNSRHSAFIQYFENGNHGDDAIYFLQSNKKAGINFCAASYDADPAYSSSHDPVLRSYLANKKYREYCIKRLEQIYQEQQ